MLRPILILGLIVSFGLAQAQNPQPAAGTLTRLQFPNTDVKQVLEFYERLTGKRLVLDNQVQGTLNIVVSGEVPQEEAIRIIEVSLLLNGITLIPVEHSAIVRVVGGKTPRSASIPIITDESQIPDGDRVITYFVKLQYADPQDLQSILTTLIGQAPGGYSNISALPKAQALLITENVATIRSLLRVIHETDAPPAEVVSEFIPLERADAKEVLEKLNAIFEKQPGGATKASSSALPPPPGSGGAPGNAPQDAASNEGNEGRGVALSEDSVIIGKIKLSADVRTNRIHVVTRPINLPFVRKLVREFDSTVSFGEPVARTLRNVPVADVLDVIVKAITEPGSKSDEGGANSARPESRTANRMGSTGGGTSFGTGSSTGSDGGSSFSVTEGLATEPVNTTPEARIVGTTKIIADKNANAIIVIGNEDAKAKVFRLLDYLDRRIPQVMLQTIIGELNLTEKEQFGVDYILHSNGLGSSPIVLNGTTQPTTSNDGTGTGAAATGSGNAGTSGTSTTTNNGTRASDFIAFNGSKPGLNLGNLLNQDNVRAIGAGGASGLSGFVTAGNSMTAIVSALENTDRFRVVSRPSVFTRNNKKAIIASGQEIAVPVNIQSAVSAGVGNNGLVSNSSVQFKRVALQLEVVPLINSDREVSLDILQKVDEVSGSTRIDNADIPNIATRFVRTSVSVPNEGTLVLGGLIKQSFNRTRSGIPVLGKLPLVGALFSNNMKEKIRTELVILIRPQVTWATPETNLIRQRAEEFLNMDPNLESTLYPRGAQLEGEPVPFARAIPVRNPTSKTRPAQTTPAQARR